jgi:2-methylcitrate dehydratase
LLAVAALDGDVQPAQLEPRRIERPDVQGLLRRVEVRTDDRLSVRYAGEFPSRVTVRLKVGRSYNHEVKDYPGFPTRPFTWGRTSRRSSTSSWATAPMRACASTSRLP